MHIYVCKYDYIVRFVICQSGKVHMVLKKKSVSLSGRNENSTTWSVDLEIPLFGIEKVDLFYGSVCEAVLERAKRDGLNVRRVT